jgi:leucyl-tRNA synthetase
MYDHQKIEKQWQARWLEKKQTHTPDEKKGQRNFYVLVEFPYPSGNLHAGHWYAFAVPDIFVRMKKMQGFNVLYPIGFDAFGLPAENAALKRKLNPREWTYGNIDYMRAQLKTMGASFDWSREIITCDAEYYKWTQWLFLQFFKKKLAYQAATAVNWCPSCKTVLANEQVAQGKCERCEYEVEQKKMKQWQLKIRNYADKLLDGLDKLNWPEEIKESQRNWIGRSQGTLIKFQTTNNTRLPDGEELQTNSNSQTLSSKYIEVFTTRPDTLFGATYMVLTPEHELIANLKSQIENWHEVEKYIKRAKSKTELERQESKEKTGVELKGVKAINPASNEEIPVWMADYVLASYGTGAIMAVPAHDERDFEFAKKYDLPIKEVVVKKIGERKKGAIHRNGVFGVIKNNNKILLLFHRRTGYWRLPGGVYEKSENDIEALKREVKEETGYINLEIKDYLGQIEANYYALDKTELRHRYAKGYLLTLRDKRKVKLSEEESERFKQEWLDPKDALKKLESNPEPWGEAEFVRRLSDQSELCFTGEGIAVNSEKFDGLETEEFKEKITKWLEEKGLGKKATTYRIRDWVVSRQRYWGCPIPIIHCAKCGAVPVPEKNLPVELPDIKDYKPTGDGRSPLAKAKSWVKVKCPKCNSGAERETDTLDTFVDSSWYCLRYIDPDNKKEFAGKSKMKHWLPVNFYSGGAEHTTMHLLYSRFWMKAMHELGLIEFNEPYIKRMNRGLILGPDNRKMSKSRGNVIDPDEYVKALGADTVRMYLAFIGPYHEVGAYPWNPKSILGIRRFLDRVWDLITQINLRMKSRNNAKIRKGIGKDSQRYSRITHQTIKKVTEDIEAFKFNTAIAQLMIYVNELIKFRNNNLLIINYQLLITLLAPFAPHFAEELWEKLGYNTSIFTEKWPKYNAKLARIEEIELVIQVNGKVRDKIKAAADVSEAEAKNLALSSARIKLLLKTRPKKIIFVPGKLINIVS